jgi:hypothetical protein
MKKTLGILFFSLLLSACSSSTKISQAIESRNQAQMKYANIELKNKAPDAPEHFSEAVKSYLKMELKNKGFYSENDGSSITVDIVDYRMRSGFTRAMFGILAGKDGVDSEVTVTDENGKVIGKSKVSSFNVMAIGDMQDIARMHAEEIAKFLIGKQG